MRELGPSGHGAPRNGAPCHLGTRGRTRIRTWSEQDHSPEPSSLLLPSGATVVRGAQTQVSPEPSDHTGLKIQLLPDLLHHHLWLPSTLRTRPSLSLAWHCRSAAWSHKPPGASLPSRIPGDSSRSLGQTAEPGATEWAGGAGSRFVMNAGEEGWRTA